MWQGHGQPVQKTFPVLFNAGTRTWSNFNNSENWTTGNTTSNNAGKTCSVPFANLHQLMFDSLESLLNLESPLNLLIASTSLNLASIPWDHSRDPQICLLQWGSASQGYGNKNCRQIILPPKKGSKQPCRDKTQVRRCLKEWWGGERNSDEAQGRGARSAAKRAGQRGVPNTSLLQTALSNTSTKTWQLTAVTPTSFFFQHLFFSKQIPQSHRMLSSSKL